MPNPLRLAVLLSGSGRTLDNILSEIDAGRLAARVEVVVSNKPGVRGLAIAERAGVPAHVVPRDDLSLADWSRTIFDICRAARADLVVMAGFLQLIEIPADFTGHVINIHPALLPAFGGKGFHGMHVHRAVLARGCTVTGCTVHLVDNEYDHGHILLQKTVPVLADDTADSLAARVFAAECVALPEAIARFKATPAAMPSPGSSP